MDLRKLKMAATKVIFLIFMAYFLSEESQALAPNEKATGLLVGKLFGATSEDLAWSAFNLYNNDDNPLLQGLSLQGRLHLQTTYGVAGEDHYKTSDYKAEGNDESVWGNDLEVRRARIGFKSRWLRYWKLEGQINVDVDGKDDADHLNQNYYKDIFDLYVAYGSSEIFNVAVGKNKIRFSREQEISSNSILTIEHSLLANALFPGELTGIWTNGKGVQDRWLYEFGLFGSERVREFSEFDQGVIVLGKVGYEYSAQSGIDAAAISIHYLHNNKPGFQASSENNFIPAASPLFTDSIALNNYISHGRYGLITEMIYGFGYDGEYEQRGELKNNSQSNVFGITISPAYDVSERIQLVGRLQFAASENDGLQVPLRYERIATDGKGNAGRGNTYVSTYIGLNYYIHGHKLKLMNGIEYSDLGGGDYDGYTFTSALRFSF